MAIDLRPGDKVTLLVAEVLKTHTDEIMRFKTVNSSSDISVWVKDVTIDRSERKFEVGDKVLTSHGGGVGANKTTERTIIALNDGNAWCTSPYCDYGALFKISELRHV